MRLLSVSFLYDMERGSLGHPRFLGAPSMLNLEQHPDTAPHHAPKAPAATTAPAGEPQPVAYRHCCPVCGTVHWVNAARHSVAYGKQLTCCCECEVRSGRW
jgi:hypothetical protein